MLGVKIKSCEVYFNTHASMCGHISAIWCLNLGLLGKWVTQSEMLKPGMKAKSCNIVSAYEVTLYSCSDCYFYIFLNYCGR
jgi:hypothetical protein